MKAKSLTLGLCAATLTAVTLYPQLQTPVIAQPNPTKPAAQVHTQERPRIDVVFVLDTTGSMGGLIETAKEKIWSIATTMAQARPSPEIRVGLVAYRDRGDAYVTQRFDLTTDLDSMYATLMDFQADGGGDGPEAVNQALEEAVTRMSWTNEKDAYKVVFLVGDAPPHMDYQDDVKYPQVLAQATARGITVNTIQCGGDVSATQPFQQIAALGDGNYLQVEQAGSAVAVTTPYDDKLAQLAAKLDATRMTYGDAEQRAKVAARQAAMDKVSKNASTAAKARRAEFNATESGAKNLASAPDLVADVASGKVDANALAASELPAAVAVLAPAERDAYLADQAKTQDSLKKEIAATAEQRAAFIKDKVAADGGAAASLDHQVFGAVKAQAEKKGLRYDSAVPVY